MVLVQNAHFSKFLFRQYRPEKCLLRYSRTKKRLSRPEKQQVRKVDIDIFPNRLTHGFAPKMIIFQPFFLGNIA